MTAQFLPHLFDANIVHESVNPFDPSQMAAIQPLLASPYMASHGSAWAF